MHIKWHVFPEPTPHIKQIKIEIDGQVLRYYNGPQEWQTLEWPQGKISPHSEIIVKGERGHQGSLQCQNDWGFLCLLSKSTVKLDKDNIYHASWQLPLGRGRYSRVSLRLREGELIQALFSDKFELAPFIERSPLQVQPPATSSPFQATQSSNLYQ